MTKSWVTSALLALATLSTARAACDDLESFLNVPSPLTQDTTITLDVGTIECPSLDASMEVEEIIVEGGTLTIASDSTVQFINVAFTVMPGAALVLDMPETKLGPSSNPREDFPSGSLIEISEDASVTFTGDVVAQEVGNVGILLRNAGALEFKKTALFVDNINVLPVNTGTVRFRDYAAFTGNEGVAISASENGFVRFSAEVLLDDNGSDLDGARGCAISNHDTTSRIIFRGQVTVSNTRCRRTEGVPVFNRGTLRFHGKTYFNDNNGSFNGGGAVRNLAGSTTFNSAVQFNDNQSEGFGGGLSVEGGDVTFEKAVLFDGNAADNGGAFSVSCGFNAFGSNSDDSADCGTLTFKKPRVVRIRNNIVDEFDEDDANCTVGVIEDGATLVGFPGDDICAAASS